MSSFTSFVAAILLTLTALLALILSPVTVFESLMAREFPVHDLQQQQAAVFITGTSSGIGRHAAIHLAKEGYFVFGTVRKDADATALRDEGLPNLIPLVCDVTNAEQVSLAREQVATWLQQGENRVLAGVVNNAGIGSEVELMENTPVDTVRFVMEVNLMGPLQVYQAFLPLIRQSKGRFLFVGSVAGMLARTFRGPYTMSKFSLEGLVDTLRQELYFEGIAVVAINPAYIATEIGRKTIEASKEKFGDKEERPGFTNIQNKMLAGFQSSYRKSFEVAPGPQATTMAIVEALTSPKPRTRYFPGSLGKLPGWVAPKLKQLFPDRLIDAVILKVIQKIRIDG